MLQVLGPDPDLALGHLDNGTSEVLEEQTILLELLLHNLED